MAAKLLRAYPFQDVTAAELAPLLPSFRLEQRAAGALVWRQGDPADELWFVLEGLVHSIHASPDGAEVVTQVATAGESFGQPALFAPDATRIVSVVAVVPTTLLSLPREPLLRFLESHPVALRRMLESLSILVLSQSSLFGQVAFHEVRGRVASQLLRLADEYGQPVADGTRIPFRLSQGTIAGLVASSRESVNRALAAFVAAGDIRHDDGHIVVLRPDALRRLLSGS
jgi:CRP/FNR family cyclic AMP-dependent transcriptional regulator